MGIARAMYLALSELDAEIDPEAVYVYVYIHRERERPLQLTEAIAHLRT